MDDDLVPITAEPADMTLTLPKGNRQMRLSALAFRWLREARGLSAEDRLSITLAGIKGTRSRYAVVYDPDGLVVDPGNYYCSGVALRRLLDHPKEMVRIPLVGNAEKMRLEFDLKAATIQPQAGGAPAAERKPSGSEPRKGADDQVAPRPNKAAALREETAKAAERQATTATCPRCQAEAAQQGTLTDYTVKPPRVSALVFSCPNGHRFETTPDGQKPISVGAVASPIDPTGDGMAVSAASERIGVAPEGVALAEVSSAQGGGVATPPPHADPPVEYVDRPDPGAEASADYPASAEASGLPPEDTNVIDTILDADAADDAENEVDPEWLAALHGETE